MTGLDELLRSLSNLSVQAEQKLEAYGGQMARKLEQDARRMAAGHSSKRAGARTETEPADGAKQPRSRRTDEIKGSCVKTPDGVRITLSRENGESAEFGAEHKDAVIFPTLRREARDVLRGFRLF